MRISYAATIAAFLSISTLAVPAFADTFVTYSTPTSAYTSVTTDSGGGDGSGNAISSLGATFSFSYSLTEDVVPSTWYTWNSPPLVESSTPNVLFDSSNTLLITVASGSSTVGFELDPNLLEPETIAASFYNTQDQLIDTINLTPGMYGALLFGLSDTSPGEDISQVSIIDTTDGADGFAIAQLRSGNVVAAINNPPAVTPEPSSLVLLGTGLAGLAGAARRRFFPVVRLS